MVLILYEFDGRPFRLNSDSDLTSFGSGPRESLFYASLNVSATETFIVC